VAALYDSSSLRQYINNSNSYINLRTLITSRRSHSLSVSVRL